MDALSPPPSSESPPYPVWIKKIQPRTLSRSIYIYDYATYTINLIKNRHVAYWLTEILAFNIITLHSFISKLKAHCNFSGISRFSWIMKKNITFTFVWTICARIIIYNVNNFKSNYSLMRYVICIRKSRPNIFKIWCVKTSNRWHCVIFDTILFSQFGSSFKFIFGNVDSTYLYHFRSLKYVPRYPVWKSLVFSVSNAIVIDEKIATW